MTDIPSPASGNSPASLDSLPETPVSPTAPNQTLNLPSSDPASAPAANKRKPSRRANTAERRATHNAVERQRRETLNSRFLDLAALLPNLSQIRRPSKSAIVNSSIAHIHSGRRHRAMASRELRTLKSEADALRRELNEWRDRSGLPRVEEPMRSDAFGLVLSGEVEILPIIPGMEDEDMEDDEDGLHSAHPDSQASSEQEILRAYAAQAQAQAALQRAQLARQNPLITSAHQTVAYDNPALAQQSHVYEPIPPQYQQQQLQQQYGLFDDKHAWSTQLVAAQQQMQLQAQAQAQAHAAHQQGYTTPPGSAHGYTPPNSGYGTPPSGYFPGGRMNTSLVRGSPVDDYSDASSVGSGRPRSGSFTSAAQQFDLVHDRAFSKRLPVGAGYPGFPLVA
jgi:hypothetical protein